MSLRPLVVPMLLITAAAAAVAFLLLVEPPLPPEDDTDENRLIAKVQEAAKKAAPAQTTAASTPTTQPEPEVAAEKTAAPKVARIAPLPETIRDVSPEGLTPPDITGPLVRIQPSEEYLERLKPVEVKTDGKLNFRRPEILSIGTLRSKRLTIHLAKIEDFDLSAECALPDGSSWPCGPRAKTALQSLLRQYKITCRKTGEVGTNEIEASCLKGRTNVSEWLVRYGWAIPTQDAPDKYRELAARAKDRKLGRWREDWQLPPELRRDTVATLDDTSVDSLLPSDVTENLVDTSVPGSGFGIVVPDVQSQSLDTSGIQTSGARSLDIQVQDLPPIE